MRSNAASALGQMLIPAPEDVSVRSLTTVTAYPRRCIATAVARPAMPAPITRIRCAMVSNLTPHGAGIESSHPVEEYV